VAALLRGLTDFGLPSGTYLAGGAALAIYMGHRVSVDIDLFTPEHFFCGPIIAEMRKHAETTVLNAAESDTLLCHNGGVKFSLFHYPYPLLEPPVSNPEAGVPLSSVSDIAAMKTVAIVQRGTAKDFVDLKTIIEKTGQDVQDLLALVRKKYGVSEGYDYQVKKSLVFFDDARRGLGDVLLFDGGAGKRMEPGAWNDLERFFKKLVMGR
jgi:hypothetical protein